MRTTPALIHIALLLVTGVTAIAAPPAWIQAANGTVFDAQGNAYLVGSVTTDIVPVTRGAFQTKFTPGTCGSITVNSHGGTLPIPCRHGFAVKISSDGSTILYATYLAGSGSEDALPLGVDASGNLLVRGSTSSADFPVTSSIAGLPPIVNESNFYILKLSSDGAGLVFSDLFNFPPPSYSTVNAAALTSDGMLVFGGRTDGTAFPTTPGAYLSARPNVSLDGFVFKWDPQTNVITHSTLIGGSDQDFVTTLTVDPAGNVFVAGYTGSQDFPVSQGAFYSPGTVTPRVNDFVAKFDPNLSTLAFSALFGGSYHPIPNAIALDASGDVYVAGAGSPDLPVSPGAFETSFSNGFLGKFDTNGARIYLTYLGDGPQAGPGVLAPAFDGSIWVSGGSALGGLVTTPDALELMVPVYSLSYLKHISADGSQQLFGSYLQEFLGMVRPGVTLSSGSTNFFTINDLNFPPQTPQTPRITSVVNSASMSQPGYIAPGEIVSIFGLSIGPNQSVSYELNSEGRISSNLHGLQVLFDGIAAPILYASRDQINVVVPFSMPIPTDGPFLKVAALQVKGPGNAIAFAATPQKVASLPGIFQSGGTGLILNQDGSLNGAANSAKQGSVITLFTTGLGQLTPVPQDGSIPKLATLRPTLPVQVFLGNGNPAPYMLLDTASVKYVGDAPGQIEGVQQINLQLPAGTVFSSLYIQVGTGISNAITFFEQ